MVYVIFLMMMSNQEEVNTKNIKFDTEALFGWNKPRDKWIHLTGLSYDILTTHKALSIEGSRELNNLLSLETGDSLGTVASRIILTDILTTFIINRLSKVVNRLNPNINVPGWKITFSIRVVAGTSNVIFIQRN